MTVTAPVAPGKLGDQLVPEHVLIYLTALDAWLAARRAELDELDRIVLASPQAAPFTNDVRLGMTLWQAIKTRYGQAFETWDSGRVGLVEREKLSQLIHGRLDAPGLASGASLPEACTLSDALTSQLRTRLQVDGGGDALVRLAALRAQTERLRDQVGLEPSDVRGPLLARVDGFAAKVSELREKAIRGADVGGLLGTLEAEGALFERDLIVGGAERRTCGQPQAGARLAEVTALRQRLLTREAELRALVEQVVASVTEPPKYAVPSVEKLGPVPGGADALTDYATTLGRVNAAFDKLEQSYRTALGGAE